MDAHPQIGKVERVVVEHYTMHHYRHILLAHTYIHACMHTCMHACMHACIHTITFTFKVHVFSVSVSFGSLDPETLNPSHQLCGG